MGKALRPVLRADLVIVDDIGLLPITAEAAEGLYRLVDAAYETALRGPLVQSPPLRLRRAHAPHHRHRPGRPARAPRARARDVGRLGEPPRGCARQGGETFDLPRRGIPWPGRAWGPRWPAWGTHVTVPGEATARQWGDLNDH